MRKIKIAQIGTSANSHGNFIFESLKKQSDSFDVVGYTLPENEREKFPQCMKYFDGAYEMTVEEILNDPDIEAVAIETEEIYLTKYALMAAMAGKHIHMEKPGSQSLSEFEKLIGIMKDNSKVFHTGYMYRYNPMIIELMKSIKAGELGEIINVDAQMNCVHTVEQRKWMGNFKGGMLFFLGCHLIDLILQIKGEPQEVIPLSCSTGLDGCTAEDFGMGVLRYKNGVCLAKAVDAQYGGFAMRNLTVVGSKGTVELCPLEMYSPSGDAGGSLLYTQKTEYKTKSWSDKGIVTNSEDYERFDNMMSAFASYVRGEKENPYTLDYELKLYKCLLKCCGIN